MLIFFPRGLPGFEEWQEYDLYQTRPESPFYNLQCRAEPQVSFLLVNPFGFTRSYEFDLPETVRERLQIADMSDVAVFNIINPRNGLASATVNMQAPVVINIRCQLGEQVILEETRYSLRTPLQQLITRGEV